MLGPCIVVETAGGFRRLAETRNPHHQLGGTPVAKRAANPDNFVTPKGNAKSAYKQIIAQFVRIARREHLDYDTFTYCCRRARRVLGLRKPKGGPKAWFSVIRREG
jgi:hypothetical protein